MSYTKKTWATGDTITADALNNIEEGIALALPTMLVRYDENYTLDHTWQQIYDALENGISVFVVGTYEEDGEIGAEFNHVCLVDNAMNGFNVYVGGNITDKYAVASTANSYPVMS